MARPQVPVTLAFLCVAQVHEDRALPHPGVVDEAVLPKRWCDLIKNIGGFFGYFYALTFDQKVKSVCVLFCIFGEIDFYVVNV